MKNPLLTFACYLFLSFSTLYASGFPCITQTVSDGAPFFIPVTVPFGQSFSTDGFIDPEVTMVEVYMGGAAGPVGNITLEIRAGVGVLGPIVYTQGGISFNEIGIHQIQLLAPAPLQPDQNYTLVFSNHDGLMQVTGAFLSPTNSNPYENGGFQTDIIFLEDDMYFKIFMSNCNVIPTLSQWGVVVLGLLLMIFGFVYIRDSNLQRNSPSY